MTNISIILQARTGSTRLPSKMTKCFYEGMSLLDIIIMRLKAAGIPIIVATTTNRNDDLIENIARLNDVNVFRGSENDVLSRFIGAAEFYNVTKIIRVCADNPLLDIDALIYLIESFSNSNVDYWCYSTKNKIPTIKTHYGFWTEGVTLDALKRAQSSTTEKIYKEHVTNFIYLNKNLFSIHYEVIHPSIERNQIRLTVDSYEDFSLIKNIYSELIKEKINLKALEVSDFISKRNEWLQIMNTEIDKNSK